MEKRKMEYKARCGDIFLCDSDRTGAKIVKFLMTAPTIWQHVWRKIRGTQEIVRFYHAGMIISNEQMVEQQWKVQYANTQKILGRKVIIYRNKNITEDGQWIFKGKAAEDIGKTYDIPQLIGKTLTWLTGIKLFVRFLGSWSNEEEICVTRVGDWYEGICNFGVKTKSEITTKILDEYCQKHTDEWEIAYTN
jgi:hypothetical protein